jgi:hypothetical protein
MARRAGTRHNDNPVDELETTLRYIRSIDGADELLSMTLHPLPASRVTTSQSRS